jgi:hypothetical protein
MSSRRLARGAGKTPTGSVPKVLIEYAKTGGFWDDRAKVEKWCEREGFSYPPDPYFAHPPGLRQWCIDAWAKREGFVNQWGHVNSRKLEELGIWRGYGRSSIRARHSQMFRTEDLEAWRPISAPHNH